MQLGGKIRPSPNLQSEQEPHLEATPQKAAPREMGPGQSKVKGLDPSPSIQLATRTQQCGSWSPDSPGTVAVPWGSLAERSSLGGEGKEGVPSTLGRGGCPAPPELEETQENDRDSNGQ